MLIEIIENSSENGSFPAGELNLLEVMDICANLCLKLLLVMKILGENEAVCLTEEDPWLIPFQSIEANLFVKFRQIH